MICQGPYCFEDSKYSCETCKKNFCKKCMTTSCNICKQYYNCFKCGFQNIKHCLLFNFRIKQTR